MNNHIPALYTPTPTLAELYEEDSTLFATLSLPVGLEIADVSNVLLLKFKTLETIFATATEAKAGIAIWSAALVANWGKMWAALQESYKPLENYAMLERMTDDETVKEYGKTSTRTDNLQHRKTGSDTTTPNLTDTETPNETRSTNSNLFGYNSAEGAPDSSAVETRTGSVTRATTGTTETEYDTTDADTGTQSMEDGGSDTETRNYLLTRTGNIGVTTSQQMLESELMLRGRWNMYEIIAATFMRDICVGVW